MRRPRLCRRAPLRVLKSRTSRNPPRHFRYPKGSLVRRLRGVIALRKRPPTTQRRYAGLATMRHALPPFDPSECMLAFTLPPNPLSDPRSVGEGVPKGPDPSASERVAVLDRYAILDTPREAEFNEIADLAAQICETPVALVSLVD